MNKRCKLRVLNSETPFKTCEEADGNKNLCTRYTGNNICLWD